MSNVNITTRNISFTRRIEKDSRISGPPLTIWKTFGDNMSPESGRLMEHRALYFTIIMNKGD